jgi:cytochrome c-type biogenesis protein CcmF
MTPEIGQLFLSVALVLAICQSIFPLVGAQIGRRSWQAVAVPAASGQFVFVTLAFGCLATSFMQGDFSVLYVATNSNSRLPDLYKFAAVWGGHEGSLLLWAVILAAWTMAVVLFSGSLPREIVSRIFGVLGVISTGFISFILFTSNPFTRLSPVPIDGNDLNPLLQDPAMAIHPPMLYIGYVGFAVAFAFAVAALLSGKVDQAWARWARPWTTAAWVFLSCGIALGSWWAYYELGWGGWWFWDPVENASFMPWLVGTALIHSLAVTEKRGLFKGTTLLLAIGAFSLSLIGTFLVRSGVLVSVHAFASDPTRGLFILGFLTLVIGSALGLYAWRAPSLDREVGFKPVSRESFLLLNNVLLCIAAGLIFLGTLYPLVLDALDLGKISVGPPYFAAVFVVPMLPLVLATGIGMHTAWRAAEWSSVARRLRIPFVLALLAGLLVPLGIYGSASALTVAGVTAAAWLLLASAMEPVRQLTGRGSRLTAGALGMSVAHFGLGLCVLGVTVTSAYEVQTDERLAVGGSTTLAGYDLHFREVRPVQGPNYMGLRGEILIERDGRPVATVYPEKRTYSERGSPFTEAGIDAGWRRDLFVAMGDDLGQGAWSVRIQYKPLVRFIWFGVLVMAIGGLIAISDRRYRQRQEATAPAAGSSAVAEA